MTPSAGGAGADQSGRSRILIVDDDPSVAEYFARLASQNGYEVQMASSGESALETIAEGQPDLVLMDVMMPGIGGFEAC